MQPTFSGGVPLPVQHEGDWENINLILNPITRVPSAVHFYAHGDPDERAFSELLKSGGLHPVVYSAWTAHGSYAEPGEDTIAILVDYRADGGEVWRTWLVLRPAQDEPWHGFGGAWGEKGSSGDATGPLGPSEWKLAAFS